MEIGTETADASAQETAATDTTTDAATSTETDGIDWKAKAREWERRAKENKSAADDKRTVEQKLAALEAKHAEAEARVLRSNVAAEYGISTKKGPNGEPSDADLFLTGSDEATLTAQAERLAARVADQKKNGNVARKEGGNTSTGQGDAGMREFTRNLFGRAD